MTSGLSTHVYPWIPAPELQIHSGLPSLSTTPGRVNDPSKPATLPPVHHHPLPLLSHTPQLLTPTLQQGQGGCSPNPSPQGPGQSHPHPTFPLLTLLPPLPAQHPGWAPNQAEPTLEPEQGTLTHLHSSRPAHTECHPADPRGKSTVPPLPWWG